MISKLEAAFGNISPKMQRGLLSEILSMREAGAAGYNSQQTETLETIIQSLTRHMNPGLLAEFGRRLLALNSAPPEAMLKLSYENNIDIAGPILEKSKALADADLINVAKTKGAKHRLAIAGRQEVKPAVTEVLVESGDRAVMRKVTANTGASFSENTFVRLVNEARKDQDLASLMAKRVDVPQELQPFVKLALG